MKKLIIFESILIIFFLLAWNVSKADEKKLKDPEDYLRDGFEIIHLTTSNNLLMTYVLEKKNELVTCLIHLKGADIAINRGCWEHPLFQKRYNTDAPSNKLPVFE